MEPDHTAKAPRTPPCPPLDSQELDGLDNQQLLERYKETGDPQLRWALVMRFTSVVRRIAAQSTGVYSSFAQLEDIVQEGLLVLLNAVDKYDPAKNVKFETYISKRLRGMIVDLARRQDWLPRQVRQKAIRLNRAADELATQLGRAPERHEIADYLGVSQEQYDALLSDTVVSNLISFEAVLDAYGNASEKYLVQSGPVNGPEEQMEDRELYRVLADSIGALREKEQIVLSLYYEKELNMKEIAQVLGISAARVSQIHSKALQRLRESIQTYLQS